MLTNGEQRVSAWSWNSSVPGSTEPVRIYSRRLDRRSLKRVSHSCWLRRPLLYRRECNFIRPGVVFRLREKNSQRTRDFEHGDDVAEKVRIDEGGLPYLYDACFTRVHAPAGSKAARWFISRHQLLSMIIFLSDLEHELGRTNTNFYGQLKLEKELMVF